VLFVHDVSDITVDLLKMFNYLKLENSAGMFVVETVFVGNLMSWVYWRLYTYPLHVLNSALIESHQLIANHHNGQLLYNLSPFPFWLTSNCLLVLLQVLHIFWFFLFLRIAYRLVMEGGHKAGAKEYEGESSDYHDD